MSISGSNSARNRIFAENETLFVCPICSCPMKADSLKSLICANRHCFDLAKQGYINLLTHSPKPSKYDKRLFESRRIIHKNGYFDPLIGKISESVASLLPPSPLDEIKILDAGCGEGSHLTALLYELSERIPGKWLGVGIDISKEGIQTAAKEAAAQRALQTVDAKVPETLWCVADLAKCPVADGQARIILNILSPSNYSEFKRLLTDDGIVIKVVPESDYLQPLRDMFYDQTDKQMYSNTRTAELFSQHFKLVSSSRIQYPVTVEHPDIEYLAHMTPLFWSIPEERIGQVLDRRGLTVVFDYLILIGTKL